MKVIINSDDFGLSRSINKGIIEAFNEGLISSTTLMINMPYAEEAIELYKQVEGLGMGVHLNITAGSPLSSNIPSLVDENNIFYRIKDFKNHVVVFDEAYKEMKAQIEKVLSYDINISHIDCHHFLVENDTFREIIIILGKEYNVPVRILGDSMKKECEEVGVKTADMFFEDFYGDNAKSETILNLVNENSNCSSIEFMCHLGYIDEDTKTRTSYLNRENEINELRKLKGLGFYETIELINYHNL
jgi:Uncharacterized protein conserved in bacteria